MGGVCSDLVCQLFPGSYTKLVSPHQATKKAEFPEDSVLHTGLVPSVPPVGLAHTVPAALATWPCDPGNP